MNAGLALALAIAASPAVAPKGLPDDSMYVLDGVFRDQHGDEARLDVFKGKPVLLAMFYATCPSACPRLIADVKRVLAGLDDAQRKEVRVILVSLDPEHDTPPVLAGVVKARELDDERTRLVVGSAEHTRELAAALGVKYRPDGKGAIDHSSRIVVLDRAGRSVGRRDGLGGSVDDTTKALLQVLQPVAQPR